MMSQEYVSFGGVTPLVWHMKFSGLGGIQTFSHMVAKRNSEWYIG